MADGIDPAHRQARRRSPRPRRRGPAPRRGQGPHDRRACGCSRSTARTAEEHYGEHREKPFFGELVDFITGGPVVVARISGEQAIAVLADADGPHEPRRGAARIDPRRSRHADRREHRARQRLARVRRARAGALLRLSGRSHGAPTPRRAGSWSLAARLAGSTPRGAVLGAHRPRAVLGCGAGGTARRVHGASR